MTTSDGTHTLHRIDVKDQLPREESWVLVWGRNPSNAHRWIDVFQWNGETFVDDNGEPWGSDATHWASLVPLNWNDGLPLHRSFVQ